MASLEDYDEFGNYIGGDLESDEDEDNLLQEEFSRPQVQQQPLEGFEQEPGPDDQALMEVDGKSVVACPTFMTYELCFRASS